MDVSIFTILVGNDVTPYCILAEQKSNKRSGIEPAFMLVTLVENVKNIKWKNLKWINQFQIILLKRK